MRSIIRKLARKFGYDFVKLESFYTSKSDKTVTINFYGVALKMPASNPLSRTYTQFRDFNSIIGKIATKIAAKYTTLKVIDIGANIGDTLAILNKYATCTIYAFEGDDISYKFLQENAAQFSNVTIFKQFLGDENKTISTSLDKAGWNTTIIPSTDGGHTIQLKTLDSFAAEQRLDMTDLHLLKVDTEGFDTIILRGTKAILEDKKPAIFLEFNQHNMGVIREDGLSTILSLSEIGYEDIFIFDPFGNLILKTTLAEKELLNNLSNYAKVGKDAMITYYDFCIFHKQDKDIATALYAFLTNELKSGDII